MDTWLRRDGISHVSITTGMSILLWAPFKNIKMMNKIMMMMMMMMMMIFFHDDDDDDVVI